MARKIAIVEDEPAIRENYADALRRQGYGIETYGNRADALEAFRNHLPDFVILDISLGDEMEGGFDLCRDLRSMSRTLPVIFLTARDSDLDAVSGLRLGADDFITKDVSIHQVIARIAALFRRVDTMKTEAHEEAVIEVGELQLNLDRVSICWRGKPLELTLTEFWIVHSLARRAGHVKSRDQLMQDANLFVDDGTVTSHIKRIRGKFRAADRNFDCIETVYGMGYRWNSDR